MTQRITRPMLRQMQLPPTRRARAARPKPKVDGSDTFLAFWRALAPSNLPQPERERPFHPVRKWRIDVCWPDPIRLAVEIHGSVWSNGHHNRGQGLIDDLEKQRAATVLGWRVLVYTTDDLKKRPAQVIEEVVGLLRWLMAQCRGRARLEG